MGGRTVEQARGFSIATRCETVDDFVARFCAWTTEMSIFVPVAQTRAASTECGFAILLSSRKPVLAGTCVVLETFADANNAYGRPGLVLGIKRLGPDSEKVLALLHAARSARKNIVTQPVRPTQIGMPPMTVRPEPPVARAASPGVAQLSPPPAVPHPATHAMRGIDPVPTPSRGLERTPRATPPIVGPARTLVRDAVDDATPTHVGPEEKTEPTARPSAERRSTPRHMIAEGSTRIDMLEARTPGSPFILPANPLMNLTNESLEGFVDCRLFESTAGYAEGAPKLDPPDESPEGEPAVGSSDVLAEPTSEPRAVVRLSVIAPREPAEPELVMATAPVHIALPAVRSGGARVQLPIVFVVAVAMVGIVVGIWGARSETLGENIELPVFAAAPSPIAQPMKAIARETVVASVPAPAVKSVGSGPCALQIVVAPEGARILVDGTFAGRAPLQVRGKCTQRRIDVALPQYRNATRVVTPTIGATKSVEIALARFR